MCQKSSFSQSSVSPMTARFAKVTLVLIFFCFVECATGSCLSYGHSCWGAHGKRNNPATKDNAAKEEATLNSVPVDTRWFLSRMYPGPSDYRTWKIKDSALAGRQHNIERQMTRENELADVMKGVPEDEATDYQDVVPDMSFLEESNSKPYEDRLRLFNFLRNQKVN